MTPPLEEAQRLLRLARRDRETFDLLLPLPLASLAAFGFLAQQFVEKALKAVAVSRGVEFRYDDEIVPTTTRAELEVLLSAIF